MRLMVHLSEVRKTYSCLMKDDGSSFQGIENLFFLFNEDNGSSSQERSVLYDIFFFDEDKGSSSCDPSSFENLLFWLNEGNG